MMVFAVVIVPDLHVIVHLAMEDQFVIKVCYLNLNFWFNLWFNLINNLGVELRSDAHFDGNGWLEFSKSLLPHKNENEEEIIALELSTNKSDGLIFWHGQDPGEDEQGRDYISLACMISLIVLLIILTIQILVSDGYLEFSYDLGSGPAILRNTQIKVNDGDRHTVILKRQGREGSIEVDQTDVEEGESEGEASSLDCKGMFLTVSWIMEKLKLYREFRKYIFGRYPKC